MFSREHVRVFSETFTPVSTQANAYPAYAYTSSAVGLRQYRRELAPIYVNSFHGNVF